MGSPMVDWFILLAPLAMLPIFVLFIFVGCGLSTAGEGPPVPPDDNGDADPPSEGPPPDPPLNYIQYQVTASAAHHIEPAQSSFPFLGINIGDEMPGRHVILAASVMTEVGDVGFAITGVTINGDPASDAGVDRIKVSGNVVVGGKLAILPLDNGTTADIVVTCNQTASNWGLIVWAVYGLISSTAIDSGSTSLPPSADGMSVSPLNVDAGGLLLAAATSYHPDAVPIHEWDFGEEVDGEIPGITASHSGCSSIFGNPGAGVHVVPMAILPEGGVYPDASVLVAATFN
jgi:hypothetical protein